MSIENSIILKTMLVNYLYNKMSPVATRSAFVSVETMRQPSGQITLLQRPAKACG